MSFKQLAAKHARGRVRSEQQAWGRPQLARDLGKDGASAQGDATRTCAKPLQQPERRGAPHCVCALERVAAACCCAQKKARGGAATAIGGCSVAYSFKLRVCVLDRKPLRSHAED